MTARRKMAENFHEGDVLLVLGQEHPIDLFAPHPSGGRFAYSGDWCIWLAPGSSWWVVDA